MKNLLKKFLRYMVFNKGKFKGLYLKVCRPTSEEYASFVKLHGRLHSMGVNCRFNPFVNITDPEYVSIGNNVTLSHCNLIGHDGVVGMLNNAYNMKLDSVGKIVIGDNVFVGHGSTVLPNITIGSNVIIAAGAMVNKDVPDGVIVGGVPAKPIGRTEDLANRLKEKTETLPWAHIIKSRTSSFDPNVERELVALRVKYFYPNDDN